MATNVIVVDVINEDKIVTLEELRDMKRVPSRDSCSSRHSLSNVQTPISQSAPTPALKTSPSPVNTVHEISQQIITSGLVQKNEKVDSKALEPKVTTPEAIEKIKITTPESGGKKEIPESHKEISRKTSPQELVQKVQASEIVIQREIQLTQTRKIQSRESSTESKIEVINNQVTTVTLRDDENSEQTNESPTKDEEELPLINSNDESYVKDEEEEYLLARSNTTESEATVIENHMVQEEQKSSGSEHEVEVMDQKEETVQDDNERKSLFQQTDSVDDELPYVPTTLPQERSIGVPIVPVKQRVCEIRTCPIERPRSTTPINPACLEDYTSHDDSSTSSAASTSSGKMQIILPRVDSVKASKMKSGGKVKPWNVFAEEVLQSPKDSRKSESPPPLPPRGAGSGSTSSSHSHTGGTPPHTAPVVSNQPAPSWVSFDELPERKRAPKRITTLPHRPHHPHVVFSYVNPEDCSCECHDPKHSND